MDDGDVDRITREAARAREGRCGSWEARGEHERSAARIGEARSGRADGAGCVLVSRRDATVRVPHTASGASAEGA
jgi:hypothetical protein